MTAGSAMHENMEVERHLHRAGHGHQRIARRQSAHKLKRDPNH
jgi:hypothetical protein